MALTENEIQKALNNLNGWTYADGKISKTYPLPSYAAGIMFAGAVGTLADSMNHHPDMTIGYKKVTVTFTTHDSGYVVTEKDIEAARLVETLQYPQG